MRKLQANLSLNVAYKLFALILLNRFREAGIVKLLWHTQFGFKRQASTADALFFSRRFIDILLVKNDGRPLSASLDLKRPDLGRQLSGS